LQPDQYSYADLNLKAQLNIDADKLADQYIIEHPDYSYSKVPLLPTSGAQLNLPIGTITHKLKREIMLARTEPALQKHLCKHFKWTDETFETIDWESFRLAMNRLDKHRTTLNKHVNDITPVGRRLHRRDPKYYKGCNTCGLVDEETAIHLLECSNRTKWRNACKRAVHQHFTKENCKWAVPFEVQELLLEGITAVIEGRDPETMTFAPSVSHIAAAQTAIGWDQLFSGRLASAWQVSYSSHLGTTATKKVNGQTWATALAELLLQQWYNLWIERNGDRHGRDKDSKAAAAKRQAIREVEQLYDLTGNKD